MNVQRKIFEQKKSIAMLVDKNFYGAQKRNVK